MKISFLASTGNPVEYVLLFAVEMVQVPSPGDSIKYEDANKPGECMLFRVQYSIYDIWDGIQGLRQGSVSVHMTRVPGDHSDYAKPVEIPNPGDDNQLARGVV